MLVFVRMLPETVTRRDLRLFADRVVNSPWSRFTGKHGTVRTCDILKITDRQARSVEYHGLVDIEPASSAVAAIRKLNRSELKGKEVEVRKYFKRSALRDRRARLSVEESAVNFDRRRGDRRRSRLYEESVNVAGKLQPAHVNDQRPAARKLQEPVLSM